MSRDQQLVDALQAAIPRLQLAVRSAEQQHQDIAAALERIAHAATLLRPAAPHHDAGRSVRHLDVAIVRSGRTLQELVFLTALSEPRIKSIAAGDAPSAEEAARLRAALPDWKAE